jgi:hypothetical protein
MRKKTNEEFIDEVSKIHNYEYDYSLVDYKNNKSIIRIICHKHGEFKQRAGSHLTYGCKKCSFDKLKNTFKYFVEKSNKKHNNKFIYDEKNFIDMNTLMKITCPIHGEFNQIPHHHLYRGCKKCKNEKIGNSKRKDLHLLLEEFKQKHNNKYKYPLINFINNKTKIEILCPEHGEFKQRINDHLNGRGCPYCKESNGEKEIRFLLEKNNINFIREKQYSDCKYNRTLHFDFYLPKHNICIEFDGIQHYKSLSFFGGDIALEKSIIKDQIKTDYCINNNIQLIRIKYDENIEEKLKEILTIHHQNH